MKSSRLKSVFKRYPGVKPIIRLPGKHPLIEAFGFILWFFAEYFMIPVLVCLSVVLGVKDIMSGDTGTGNFRLIVGGFFFGWYIYHMIKAYRDSKVYQKEDNHPEV